MKYTIIENGLIEDYFSPVLTEASGIYSIVDDVNENTILYHPMSQEMIEQFFGEIFERNEINILTNTQGLTTTQVFNEYSLPNFTSNDTFTIDMNEQQIIEYLDSIDTDDI